MHFTDVHPVQGNGGTSDIYANGNRYQQPIQQLPPDQIQLRFKHLISERTGINVERIVTVGFPPGGRGEGLANMHLGQRHRIMWWDGYWFNFSFKL